MRDRPTKPLRIALVNLRSRSDDWPHIAMVPLGLMYVSAAVKRAHGAAVDVRVFDMTLVPEERDPREALAAFLDAERPDVVGLRGFTSHAAEYPAAARLAKRARPDCLVVAGGPHAATRSPGLFAAADIDLVVPGEGEEAFSEIAARLLAGADARDVPGVAYTGADGPVYVPPRPFATDLDAIAHPDYDAIDLDAYQDRVTMTGLPAERRFTSLFTSRGCHYRCTYCHENFGKAVRYRSVDGVLREIEELVERRGVREFHVVDDIFNADLRRAVEIFARIERRGWDLRLAFPNGLRGDLMNEEFVAAAKAAGAYHWGIAVESASPRVQKLVKKFNRLDRVADAIALSARYGVFTATFNMLGFPEETAEEMRATVDFNLRSAAHMAHFFIVTPFEGTRLRDQVRELGFATTPFESGVGTQSYQQFRDCDEGWFARVPRSETAEIVRDAYARFYDDGERIGRILATTVDGHAPHRLARYLETAVGWGGTSLDGLRDRAAARLLGDFFAAHLGREART